MSTAQVFAVIATRGAEVQKLPEPSYYEIKDDAWLVSYEGTTRQLAERLGIRGGESGSGLVILAAGYSGRASSDVWEWLTVRWGADD
jgi:hypothetical protein